MKKSTPLYTPPATSNWTGRAPRTTEEAFGKPWRGPEYTTIQPTGSVWIALVLTVTHLACWALGIATGILLCQP